MPQDYDVVQGEMVSEMAIVDTFTKLIFAEEGYTPRERMIIEAFREVDNNVLRDSAADMGEYLRNLGVREMIYLVGRLKDHLQETACTIDAAETGFLQGPVLKH